MSKYNHEWYVKHREREAARHSAWQKSHPEFGRQRSARYKQRHPDRVNSYYQTHRREHSEAARRLLWKYKLDAFAIFGSKCRNCGITDPRVLDINHKNGGGNKEDLFGPYMYKAIVKGERKIDDLELLCCNCNRLYEYESGRRKMPER